MFSDSTRENVAAYQTHFNLCSWKFRWLYLDMRNFGWGTCDWSAIWLRNWVKSHYLPKVEATKTKTALFNRLTSVWAAQSVAGTSETWRTGNMDALRSTEASWMKTDGPSSGLHLFLLIIVFVPRLTSGKLVEVSGSGVPPPSRWRGGESFNFLTPPPASATLNDHSSKVGHEERKVFSRQSK